MSPVPAGQPLACDVLPGIRPAARLGRGPGGAGGHERNPPGDQPVADRRAGRPLSLRRDASAGLCGCWFADVLEGAIVTEREQLERGIAALESQRGVLGDAVVDIALVPLRARLAALGTPEQQLKVVTILFTDVVGSTTLSQRLDPEDIHAIMDGALQHLTAIVESQHGRVLQYAGDSLLAVFGAVEAHEDDPERAVRAGLAILEETRRLALSVQTRHGPDGFNVRVGVHTGPVLLGGGVGRGGQHPWHCRQHCGPHGADRTCWGSAHQSQHLPPCPWRVRGVGGATAHGQGHRRPDAHLLGVAHQAQSLPRNDPRGGGHRDAHGRTRSRVCEVDRHL
ncbi:MAG: hypothetical protein DMD96_02595 [Candidatus Rokuibacteriota bacterium]|nr:MAG: hypothetical protein DMD96_02595 [Candidatus Rokubacteria bacterium]